MSRSTISCFKCKKHHFSFRRGKSSFSPSRMVKVLLTSAKIVKKVSFPVLGQENLLFRGQKAAAVIVLAYI